jgi:hypothetical protein
MKFPLHCTFFAGSVFLAVSAGTSEAALTSIFQYRFPASYDPAVTGTAVTDLGSTAHNGTLTGTAPLSTDVPAGAPAGARSAIMDPSAYNVFKTNGTDLLTNTAVAGAGGFTFDVWFKGTGGTATSGKVLDNAGTEYIAVVGSSTGTPTIFMSTSDNISNRVTLGVSDGLSVLDWNHVTFSFVVTDTSNPTLTGGNYIITLNGITTTYIGKTMSNFGDTLNRPFSMGAHPTAAAATADRYSGLIYNPSAFLGAVPEPSTGLLALAAGPLLLRRRRRA